MPKIKIDKHLFAQIKTCAETAGYSSVEEFVTHTLEKAVQGEGKQDSMEDVKHRLKGLGYIS